jgi:hypothetical protein
MTCSICGQKEVSFACRSCRILLCATCRDGKPFCAQCRERQSVFRLLGILFAIVVLIFGGMPRIWELERKERQREEQVSFQRMVNTTKQPGFPLCSTTSEK